MENKEENKLTICKFGMCNPFMNLVGLKFYSCRVSCRYFKDHVFFIHGIKILLDMFRRKFWFRSNSNKILKQMRSYKYFILMKL
jgi:hypothetical protein